MTEKRESWKLSEWNEYFAQLAGVEGPVMTQEEIFASVDWLRKNNYPKPTDCSDQSCSDYRPACKLGICYVAVQMCGDF